MKMNHIVTTCEEETKARESYKKVEPGDPVVADDELEATVKKLLALRHKMDDDMLEASKMKAVIMAAMKGSDTLKNKAGVTIATWVAGNVSKKVDYKGLLKKYKVAKEDIEAFTTTSVGSRVFSLEEV